MKIPDDFNLERLNGHVYAISKKHPNIRVSKKCYFIKNKYYDDYFFEIFKKPFWFSWFRKKRWEMSVQTNDFIRGLEFSKYLLEGKSPNNNPDPQKSPFNPTIFNRL